MKKITRCCFAFAAIIGTFDVASRAQADLTLPKILGSNMVLQQGKPVIIWGWAEKGEDVSVKLGDNESKTKADDRGNWRVELPAMKADGKTHTIAVSGKNKIELTNILVGEVWVASGQSNMGLRLEIAKDGAKDVAAADHPQIRLFHVKMAKSRTPAYDLVGQWQTCSPQTIGGISAVAYFFARDLHNELKVPIGIVASIWDGSKIEPWIRQYGVRADMYNGMIHPLTSLKVKGFIWYQGESNVYSRSGHRYFDMQKNLIEGWHNAWADKELPFYFVHIPPLDNYPLGELPKLWESQTKTLTLPNTGMVVITDVGNLKDIHPRNKKPVGKRLALWALAKNYGKDIVCSGPLYKSMKVDGDKIRIDFAHVGSGLASRNSKPLNEFKIAGADGKFVPAKATIDGNSVVVQAEIITQPKHVQFGWHRGAGPNLMNKDGLPAAPFHTNHWQGGTGE